MTAGIWKNEDETLTGGSRGVGDSEGVEDEGTAENAEGNEEGAENGEK